MILTIYERFMGLIFIPSTNSEVIWIILPLIIAVVLMQLYFGRYKMEDLGWNTAFSNSLIMIFVSMNLLKYLYERDIIFTASPKTILTFILILVGLFIAICNYFHIFQKEFAFILSSSILINITNFLVVLIVYSDFSIDFITLIAAILYGIAIFFAVKLIWLIIPESLADEDGE